MLGTAYNEVLKMAKDSKKDMPMSKANAGKLIQDGAGLVGILTGLTTLPLGKAGRFIHDVNAGIEHPKGPWGWIVGMRHGTLKGHSSTFENWWKGKSS